MTTPPPAKSPREFLILYRESNRMFNSYRIDDSQLANEHLNDQTYRNAGIPQREAIHVIEKSYASRLEQELAFVKTQWKQTSDLLEQERNRLTAELADVRKERDELLAKGKGNVFVHRHHYDQALAQAAALAGALDEADKQLSNEGDCLTCDFDGYINKTHHADCITQFIKTVIAESRAWLEKERGR